MISLAGARGLRFPDSWRERSWRRRLARSTRSGPLSARRTAIRRVTPQNFGRSSRKLDIGDIIEIATEFIKYIIKAVLDECPEEIAFLERFYERGLKEKLTKVVEDEFAKVEYTKAIEILKESGKEFVYPVEWGCDLQTEHERYLTDIVYNRPVFVVNYPKDLKSFYMKQNPDGKTVAATDLLVPGVGEIIGCSEREADYAKLKRVIIDRGMKMSDYQNYMDLRKFGSVPHSGFGLGLERILMYVTGMGNIRDTIIFPRAMGELR